MFDLAAVVGADSAELERMWLAPAAAEGLASFFSAAASAD